MEYRRLGRTGLKVSTICLGTMQFGWSADAVTSHAIMSRAVERGCNFFDTADVYSRWVDGNKGGESERIIGDWLAASKVRRDSIVLATKVRGQLGDGVWCNYYDRGSMRQVAACFDSSSTMNQKANELANDKVLSDQCLRFRQFLNNKRAKITSVF
ncbi:MAG: aldo/keto reductase [Anaerolineaceae bacterium]|nr:aldo/keto reductase [Anaerolineaceae bacterium]